MAAHIPGEFGLPADRSSGLLTPDSDVMVLPPHPPPPLTEVEKRREAIKDKFTDKNEELLAFNLRFQEKLLESVDNQLAAVQCDLDDREIGSHYLFTLILCALLTLLLPVISYLTLKLRS
jgi:hypothetical protein